MTTKRERTLRRIERLEHSLEHKRAVMARHAPGTPWHTRATRDAEGIEHTIAELRAGLA